VSGQLGGFAALAGIWALALLNVGGSRFVARYLLFLHTGADGKPVARVAIYGAGNAGARVSSVLLAGPDFESVAFIDAPSACTFNRSPGSIGSELRRQIIHQSPIRLVFSRCRSLALYNIERELEELSHARADARIFPSRFLGDDLTVLPDV
jgi:FlaA1/EpsC-like NDP-sugar epimerase